MAGDLDEIVADYTDDSVFITPRGAWRGRDGVRTAFGELLADLPNAEWDVPTKYSKKMCCSSSGRRSRSRRG
ncbi:nuclear transport factor 2 family protein [Pseudonocardia halophobica]|uniref:nuclear transport factor 2 family protein n=1 Tax=Pseudonocardia halophobica TaxID=29401 RepID=UPI003D9029C7